MNVGKIVIAGGSGTIGRLLSNHFEQQGREVVVLSRSEGKGRVAWDGKTVGFWAQSLEGEAAIVNLCGTSIAQKWTARNQALMESSRVEPTRAIGEAIRACERPPQVWINASAVGFYGDSGAKEVSEATRAGTDFLGQLCAKWEQACLTVDTPQTRKIALRIGVLIGASSEFSKITTAMARVGMTSALGSGKQYLSWIHESDLVRLVEWCLYEPVTGPLNACAPNPVTNGEFMGTLRHLIGRPALPPVPAPLVKIGAALVGKQANLLLGGQRVVPEIAIARGFKFKHTHIGEALADVTGAVPKAWQTA